MVLVVAVTGLLNLIWGFLPAYGSAYVGGTAPVLTTVGAYVPILLLIGGLVAAGAFLPGGRRHDYQTAALSGSGAVGGLATFLMGRPPLAIGAILLLIFAVVQALAAIGALLAGRSASASGAAGHGRSYWDRRRADRTGWADRADSAGASRRRWTGRCRPACRSDAHRRRADCPLVAVGRCRRASPPVSAALPGQTTTLDARTRLSRFRGRGVPRGRRCHLRHRVAGRGR